MVLNLQLYSYVEITEQNVKMVLYIFRYEDHVQKADQEQDVDVQQLCECVLLYGLYALLGVHAQVHRDHLQADSLLLQSHHRYAYSTHYLLPLRQSTCNNTPEHL